MTQLDHTSGITGYDFGGPEVPHSPVTMREFAQLRETVGLTDEDERYLRMAGEALAPHAEELVDTWRQITADHPYLAAYSARPDGSPNPEYGAATKPRFVRWVVDACTRPFDQAWLDYQHEIGRRHTRDKKNRTDHVESAEHIPLRYLLAFTAPTILAARRFLADGRHTAREVEAMHAAWTKTVILHITLWSRAYGDPADW